MKVASPIVSDPTPEDISLIESLEKLRPPSQKTAFDKALNGRWEFSFTGAPSLATTVVLLLSQSPVFLKPVLDFRNMYIEICGDQSVIKAVVPGYVLGRKADLVVQTRLSLDLSDNEGISMVEQFESIKLGGTLRDPLPSSNSHPKQQSDHN
eukprot:3935794-Ditylum_brightwellii.AAC.1